VTTTPAKHQQRRRWHTWREMLTATLQSLISDRASMAAAGSAFYATLALFPAITTLVSIYGLVFNRANVAAQLQYLYGLLPGPAYELIADWVHGIVVEPPSRLSIRLVISFVITFWSAATGTKSLLAGLNVAYNVSEQRSFLRFQLVALGTTLTAIIVAVLAIAVLVFIPVAINFVGLAAHAGALIHAAAMAMLVAFVAAAIAAFFRIGPSRVRKRGQRILAGTIAATLLWLVVSVGLTLYVAALPGFGATYGLSAGVIGIMFWFYLTAYAILFGAELNARLEGPQRPNSG
jgi:membrane protein